MIKKLINDILFHIAVTFGPYAVLVIGKTWRIRWIGEEHLAGCREKGLRVIYTFWHGRLLPLTYSHRNLGIHILISRHRDGEIIRRVTARLGMVNSK